MARREEERLTVAINVRNAAADRARAIEEELAKVRANLHDVGPLDQAHAQEIQQLDAERESLRDKLRELGSREAELRSSAARATELEDERQALEELLEEAMEDVGQKESEISELQDRLKNAAKKPASEGGSKAREAEKLARRMRTLYKNLDIDDRAISDIVALGDATMKLRAEEVMKRLADDPETASTRRKVGGLPPQLSIFEVGFAGKGRIYYSRGQRGNFRVLAVGAKNTQKTDLEYLSRLPAGT
jgi:chromosome segregation ATPase